MKLMATPGPGIVHILIRISIRIKIWGGSYPYPVSSYLVDGKSCVGCVLCGWEQGGNSHNIVFEVLV